MSAKYDLNEGESFHIRRESTDVVFELRDKEHSVRSAHSLSEMIHWGHYQNRTFILNSLFCSLKIKLALEPFKFDKKSKLRKHVEKKSVEKVSSTKEVYPC